MTLDRAGLRERCSSVFERNGANGSAVHRTQDLDVAHRINPKPPGDAVADNLHDAIDRDGRVVGWHEIEVAGAVGGVKVGHDPVVDPVGIHDDAALTFLAKHLVGGASPEHARCRSCRRGPFRDPRTAAGRHLRPPEMLLPLARLQGGHASRAHRPWTSRPRREGCTPGGCPHCAGICRCGGRSREGDESSSPPCPLPHSSVSPLARSARQAEPSPF